MGNNLNQTSEEKIFITRIRTQITYILLFQFYNYTQTRAQNIHNYLSLFTIARVNKIAEGRTTFFPNKRILKEDFVQKLEKISVKCRFIEKLRTRSCIM